MAAKRVFTTIPSRDWELLRRMGVLEGKCPGQMMRAIILQAVYSRLKADANLQQYDTVLAAEERERVIGSGRLR